jgi:uncharacterized protein YjhX (UPF0386 family)
MLKKTLRLSMLALIMSAVFVTCKKEETPPPSSGGTGGSGGGSGITAANYAGTWSVTDGCCGTAYQITITATSSTAVNITNLRKCASGSGWNITGTVSGNTLTVPAQNVVSSTQGGPYRFSGTGTLNGSSLSFPYVMADASGNFPQSCTATCTK